MLHRNAHTLTKPRNQKAAFTTLRISNNNHIMKNKTWWDVGSQQISRIYPFEVRPNVCLKHIICFSATLACSAIRGDGLSESSCRVSAWMAVEQVFTLFPFKAHLPSLLTFSEPPPCSTRHNTHTGVCLAHKSDKRNFFYKVSRRVPGLTRYLCCSSDLI